MKLLNIFKKKKSYEPCKNLKHIKVSMYMAVEAEKVEEVMKDLSILHRLNLTNKVIGNFKSIDSIKAIYGVKSEVDNNIKLQRIEYQDFYHNMDSLILKYKNANLRNCTDTTYDSTIGEWYIATLIEYHTDIPCFHVINEEIGIDICIELCNPKYTSWSKNKLSKQQKEVLVKELDTLWIRLYSNWDYSGYNNTDNWICTVDAIKPDYNLL